jgi:Xaa-Pro aminopeptidase
MVPDEEYPYADITDFKTVFAELFGGRMISRLGVVGMGSMPFGVYTLLKQDLEGVELVDITEGFEALRVNKSEYEVEMIKKAFSITDEGFKAMLDETKEGVSELFIAGTGEGICRKAGANRFGYQTIVAAGERSNSVVPTASGRVLKNGDTVMLGLSARYEGYASTAGMNVIVGGKPSAEQKDYSKMIAEAYLISREMLKPGMVGKDNYARIKKYFIDRGGYDRYIVCPFVHTIGLHEAEAPFYGPNSEDVLQPGMTVCIDTSLFGHPALYGIRMETGYLITENGHEPLSPYVDSLIERQLDM